MTSELPDGAARSKIRAAVDRNLLVEAAAGTGKTTSLVQRMVALVAGGVPVSRICAVTFTIKAAAQLDQKFQNALEQASRDETEPARRVLLETALASLDACFIGTIHAFCSRLLRERPVEAGLDPGFEEMDEAEDEAERSEAWRRFGDRLFSEGSPILARVLEAGMELKDLREAYNVLCENGDAEAASAPPGPPPDLSRVRPSLEAFLDLAAPAIPVTVPAEGWDKLQSGIRKADRMRRLLNLDSTPDLVSVLRELDRSGEFKAKRWPGGKAAAEKVAERLEEFCADVITPSLRAWQEYLHPIALAAIVPAAREYAAWRRREGRVNFQDQLLSARDLLREHPHVRRALQERFTPVLVDEFQDTDPIQAEVLLYLTGSDIEEKDWRKLKPLPGSLFVVGDPKQSIYRFRRADIQTYNTVAGILEKSGGEVLRLSTNFRSTAEICGWANRLFQGIFPESGTPSQAAHVPLAVFSEQTARDLGIHRLEVPFSRAAEMAEQDAKRIADVVGAALQGKAPFGEGGAKPSDFLIVTRRRRHLPAYARALEGLGIPYEIAGGGAFKESDEIAALLSAIQAVADPDDSTALVATLRGPLFGIEDECLYRFQRAGGRFDFRTSPAASEDARIRRAFGLLREGAEFADTLPPAAALSRFVERIGLTALAAGGSLGDARAGNLLKAMAAARELSRERLSYPEIVRRLRDLTRARDVEEMVTRPGRADVVRLMTLHRAKGLEARVVFLADPSDANPPPPNVWIDRSTDPALAHILVQRDTGARSKDEIARPLGWDEKEAREEEFLARETERLLYVAATRAQEGLVVSFRRNKDGKIGGPWVALNSFVTNHLPEVEPEPAVPGKSASAKETAAALKELRARRKTRVAVSAEPSYSAVSVTTIAHALADPALRPFAASTGKGMSWGSALHRLLEAAMRDPTLDLRSYAVNVLAEEERPPEDLEEALAAVEGVRRSPLWKQALASRRCLVEVPFAVSVPSSDLGVTEGPAETLLTGAIDLVFEEDSGWVLIDYKSDTVAGNRDALVRFYEPQIAHYRQRWRELTRRPTRAGLFFVQTGETVWLKDEGASE